MKKTTMRKLKKDFEEVRLALVWTAGYFLFLMSGMFLGMACTLGVTFIYLPEEVKSKFAWNLIQSMALMPIAWMFFMFLAVLGNSKWYRRVVKEERKCLK